MTPDRIARYIAHFNDPRQANYLAYEWEACLLNGLRRFGHITHEPDLGGRSRPDVHFTAENSAESFVADLTAVSDRGIEEANPVEHLSSELLERGQALRRRGVVGTFSFRVGRVQKKRAKGEPQKIVSLPSANRLKAVIFGQRFQEFVNRIVVSPKASHHFQVQNDEVDVTIVFNPGAWMSSGTYAEYKIPQSTRRNPVYAALHSKAGQLKRSGSSLPKGIVLCDAGCAMLEGRGNGWRHFLGTLREIFRTHTSLRFIVLFRVDHDGSAYVGPEHLRVTSELFTRSSEAGATTRFIEMWSALPSVLPRPVRTPQNANSHLDYLKRTKRWNDSGPLGGGWSMTENTVTVSAREVLEVLAGRDHPSFALGKNDDHNPFLRKLKQGRLIRRVTVMETGTAKAEEDDDLIEFEFGDPDPAASPFVAPLASRTR